MKGELGEPGEMWGEGTATGREGVYMWGEAHTAAENPKSCGKLRKPGPAAEESRTCGNASRHAEDKKPSAETLSVPP